MNATASIVKLTEGQSVNMEGSRAFYAVFTYAGYCKKYNEDGEVARKRDQDKGFSGNDLIMHSATVIAADGKGMASWRNAPTLKVGQIVEVDGRQAEIMPRRGFASDFVLRYI